MSAPATTPATRRTSTPAQQAEDFLSSLARKLLAVRGPPERRFWLIEWGHQLTDAVAGATDTGGFESDWQPAANVIRCLALQRTFWHDNLHLNPLGTCEG